MLKTRLRTAAVALPILLCFLYLGGWFLTGLAIAAFLVINYEFFGIATPFDLRRKIQLCLVNAVPLAAFALYGWGGWGGGVVFAVMLSNALHLWYVESEKNEIFFRETYPACFVGVCYPGILGSVLVIVSAQEHANLLLSWLLLVVICSDTFAYFGGRAMGRRKLSERISPNKTIEGAICGFIGALLGGLAGEYLLGLPGGVPSFLFYSVVAGVLTQVGDLVESLVKRTFGVKDAGRILPGHGGLLDRIDGLIFAAPVLFFIQVVS